MTGLFDIAAYWIGATVIACVAAYLVLAVIYIFYIWAGAGIIYLNISARHRKLVFALFRYGVSTTYCRNLNCAKLVMGDGWHKESGCIVRYVGKRFWAFGKVMIK